MREGPRGSSLFRAARQSGIPFQIDFGLVGMQQCSQTHSTTPACTCRKRSQIIILRFQNTRAMRARWVAFPACPGFHSTRSRFTAKVFHQSSLQRSRARIRSSDVASNYRSCIAALMQTIYYRDGMPAKYQFKNLFELLKAHPLLSIFSKKSCQDRNMLPNSPERPWPC